VRGRDAAPGGGSPAPTPATALEHGQVLAFSETFSHVIDFRSRFTATHSRGVAEVARALAEMDGFSPAPQELVRLAGEGEVPVVAAGADVLLKPDLAAEWAVKWKCDSERCQIKECAAEVKAVVNRPASGGYLPIEHTVTWDDACFSTDAWTFEVDQVTGKERTGEAEQNFLYGYWLGAKPGDAADRDKLSIRFGDILVAENGWRSPDYSEADAAAYMKRDELVISVDLGLGTAGRTVWTCDLTHRYIDINADYRS
jgi:hypothetical protein